MTTTPLSSSQSTIQNPDTQGRFRRFGGKYVSKALMPALAELEAAYQQYRNDAGFQAELQLLRDSLIPKLLNFYFDLLANCQIVIKYSN